MTITKRIINLIFLVLGILALWHFLGLQYAWASFYYFGEPAGLLLLLIMVLFIGGTILLGIWQNRKKGPNNMQQPVSFWQKFSSIIVQLVVSAIMILILIQNSGRLIGYDVIYAYGTENALPQINVIDGKIDYGQDTNFVIYYYNFKHGMTFSKNTWRPGESPTGYDPHEIPLNNLKRLNVVNDTDSSPEGLQAQVTKTQKSCSIKAGNTHVLGYEGINKYPNCKVIGWIKPLW